MDTTPNDSDSFWTHFEPLDEFEKIANELDEIAIPDDAYRQIKALHLALIEKASRLTQSEKELEEQKQELELIRQDLVCLRLQKSKETAESRLQKMVVSDHRKKSGSAGNHDAPVANDSESLQEPSREEHSDETVTPETPNEVARIPDQTLPEQSEEMARFQKSARILKEKSEIISAVFVELDQMVRELNRQQELMEDLKVNQDSESADELNRVTHKLKRRFRRLSKQISLP